MVFRLYARTNTMSSFHTNITFGYAKVNMLSTLIIMCLYYNRALLLKA